MALKPQAGLYRPDPQINRIADWLGDPVTAADFPQTILRFRNDRWAAAVGLDGLDDAQWCAHFGRFVPLADNLQTPLALRYHGHQFRHYNPDLGDGRGFLFAQLRDSAPAQPGGRLLDLGTKGSGQTPWSRQGDGRLTLKGAMREVLATEMLEALGVNSSKTFSVIETGEQLVRQDEPSPTRAAVLLRLSHSHIRIGSFQRLATLGLADEMAALIDYCLVQYPGDPAEPQDDKLPPAARLLALLVQRMADLAASYMVAGFVHGVLNSDNMCITGESFDYGPWRFAPRWEAGFTAAYFDHGGLYAFGRQPEAIYWNCGQMAVALRLVCDSAPLIAALEGFGDAYLAALARRFCWRLGVQPRGIEADRAMLAAAEQAMVQSGCPIDDFFFAFRGADHGRRIGHPLVSALAPASASFTALIEAYDAAPGALDHAYWQGDAPQSMLIDEVEAIWSTIDANDDWGAWQTKINSIRQMSEAHGFSPVPAGLAP